MPTFLPCFSLEKRVNFYSRLICDHSVKHFNSRFQLRFNFALFEEN